MKKKGINHLTLACLGLAGLLAAACATPEPPPREPYPYMAMSPVPPPALLDEEQPQTNSPMQEVWRKGHWTYDGLDFKWESGRVILRPHPTAVWWPDKWEKRMYGWVYMPGYWR